MELKPCPFCGSTKATFSYKRDSKKIYGAYHRICTVKCWGCTANVFQAGPTDEKAKEYAIHSWNMRADEKQPEPETPKKEYYHGFCSRCGRPVIAEKEEAFWWPWGTTDDHLCISCDACGGLAEV